MMANNYDLTLRKHTHIQYTVIFHRCKNDHFQMVSDGSNGYPQSMFVTRWTKQAFSCSKFLSQGVQLWANTAFEGSQFYSIGVPKFYSWVNVISVYVHNDLG